MKESKKNYEPVGLTLSVCDNIYKESMEHTQRKKTMTYTPLRITAEDQDDLQVIAACLQDALIPLAGMEYDETNTQFNLLVNRFCWECEPETIEGNSYYARVVTDLVFHHVKEVHRKGLDLQSKNELINLLTIHNAENGYIHLVFSGESEIKLKVDKLVCHLRDADESYPTSNIPDHSIKINYINKNA